MKPYTKFLTALTLITILHIACEDDTLQVESDIFVSGTETVAVDIDQYGNQCPIKIVRPCCDPHEGFAITRDASAAQESALWVVDESAPMGDSTVYYLSQIYTVNNGVTEPLICNASICGTLCWISNIKPTGWTAVGDTLYFTYL